MKIEIQMVNKGKAVLENDPDNMVFLDEVLQFLLAALHTQGFSYVHNLIALKDSGTQISATKEIYKIKQIYNSQDLESTVLIPTQKLVEMENDLAYYKDKATEWLKIRNNLAQEVNDLCAKLDTPPKYGMVNEDEF